jgi:cation transport ATPase
VKTNQNLLYAVLLSSPLLALLAWALQRLSGLHLPVDAMLAVSAMPAVLLLLLDSWRAIRQRDVGVDLLALMSIAGSLALDQPLTAAIIAAMTASGRWLDSYTAGRAEREMSGLLARAPRHANRVDANGLQRVALDEVRVGDRLLVKAGETVPVDGRLLDAAALLDESALTGEASRLPSNRRTAAQWHAECRSRFQHDGNHYRRTKYFQRHRETGVRGQPGAGTAYPHG